ncbi:MAG: MauE/DoxX family redox-associated membrane protein [Verrucomicrobiae bacterium]
MRCPPLLRLLARAVLGAIFLYAGAVKAGASEGFALALVPFTILPGAWAHPFAIGLAWAELAAGLLILLPRVHRIGAGLILALSVLFIGALSWALANGIIVSCGCFGGDAPPSASAMRLAILRDVAMAAAAAFALLPACPLRATSGPAK